MDSVAQANELRVQGRFADALRVLEGSRDDHDGRAADILKVDLLAQIGQYGHARVLANTLLRGKALSLAHRSACEFVLARVDKEDGDLESSVARLQKASNFALQAQDLDALVGHNCGYYWSSLNRLLRRCLLFCQKSAPTPGNWEAPSSRRPFISLSVRWMQSADCLGWRIVTLSSAFSCSPLLRTYGFRPWQKLRVWHSQ